MRLTPGSALCNRAELTSPYRSLSFSLSSPPLFWSADIFVSDHIILSEGVRDAVTFFDTRLTQLAAPTPSAIANGDEDLDESVGLFFQISAIVNDPLILFDLAGYEEKERQKRRAQKGRSGRKGQRRAILPRWLLGTLLHFSKGLSLIGIVSVFHGYLGELLKLLAAAERCADGLIPGSHLLPLAHRPWITTRCSSSSTP